RPGQPGWGDRLAQTWSAAAYATTAWGAHWAVPNAPAGGEGANAHVPELLRTGAQRPAPAHPQQRSRLRRQHAGLDGYGGNRVPPSTTRPPPRRAHTGHFHPAGRSQGTHD